MADELHESAVVWCGRPRERGLDGEEEEEEEGPTRRGPLEGNVDQHGVLDRGQAGGRGLGEMCTDAGAEVSLSDALNFPFTEAPRGEVSIRDGSCR